MSRTNIDLDDVAVERIMRMYRLRTKREAVDLAVKTLAGEPMSKEDALAMEGTGWFGALEAMRESHVTGEPWSL